VLGDSDNSDVTLITHGLIYTYVGNIKVYKCPVDVRTCTMGNISSAVLRSYSMNSWMDGVPAWGDNITPPPAPQQVDFKKLTAISAMSPANAILFIEENPATINDGYWAQNLCQPTIWVDSPAHYHNRGGAMSFADGHSQIRAWSDSQVLNNATNPAGQAWNGFPCDPTSSDLSWVQAHVTVMQ
jgi:prepilin-type processing-associated H-X9-DG protein